MVFTILSMEVASIDRPKQLVVVIKQLIFKTTYWQLDSLSFPHIQIEKVCGSNLPVKPFMSYSGLLQFPVSSLYIPSSIIKDIN